MDAALELGRITPSLAARFHELRRFRNPYARHREITHSESFEKRLVESQEYPESVLEADARKGVETVVDLLRHLNPQWKPGNEGEMVFTF